MWKHGQMRRLLSFWHHRCASVSRFSPASLPHDVHVITELSDFNLIPSLWFRDKNTPHDGTAKKWKRPRMFEAAGRHFCGFHIAHCQHLTWPSGGVICTGGLLSLAFWERPTRKSRPRFVTFILHMKNHFPYRSRFWNRNTIGHDRKCHVNQLQK